MESALSSSEASALLAGILGGLGEMHPKRLRQFPPKVVNGCWSVIHPRLVPLTFSNSVQQSTRLFEGCVTKTDSNLHKKRYSKNVNKYKYRVKRILCLVASLMQ